MIHLLTALSLIVLAFLPAWQGALPVPSGAATQQPPVPDVPVVPATMRLVGQLGGDINSVATSINHVFVGVGPRLVVYYTYSPGTPLLLAQSQPLPQVVEDVYADVQDRAFIAAGLAGLHIVQYQDGDSETVPLGSVDTPGVALGVTVANGFAYVADFVAGVQVIDVHDPTAPALVGSLDTPGTPVDVTVSNGRLYVADGVGLSIASLADPSQPVLLGSVQTPDFAQGVAVIGTLAYVADGASGLQVVDATDPTAPSIVGSVDTPGIAHDLTAFSNRVQLADGPGGLRIIDISDPTNPQEAGHLDTPGDALAVDQAPGQGYVADKFSLIAFTAPNPAQPTQSGLVDPPGYVESLAVDDGYAYLAGGLDGFRIVDVHNPTQPVQVGVTKPADFVEHVTVRDNLAYLSAATAGLRIMNVSDPANPTEIGFYDSPGWVEDLARHYSFTVYHPTSTCAMGKVVDGRLRVDGVANLRIADASIMPNVVSGNTNAASIMIGEKAAEMIARDHYVTLNEFVGATPDGTSATITGLRLVGPRAGGEGAGFEPLRSICRETVGDQGLVAVELRLCQHVAPPAVGSLVEERVRSVLEDHVDAPAAASFLAHLRESASPDGVGPEVLGDLDVEEGGESPHLALEVGFQIVVVHEVREPVVAQRPPRRQVRDR